MGEGYSSLCLGASASLPVPRGSTENGPCGSQVEVRQAPGGGGGRGGGAGGAAGVSGRGQ